MHYHRYCDCEDFPCCGHTDDDGSHHGMSDEEIREMIYEMDEDDLDNLGMEPY